MALFPQSFLDDLKGQIDIVSVVGDVVSLRKSGATWKGLCPFHQEKTPSFHVNRDKGVFKCFGCGAGGDAIAFVELQQKIPFPEAVRSLAQRVGLPVPESPGGPEDRAAAAEREALVALHEQAAAFYVEQLAAPGGARARQELDARGLSPETRKLFGYGYAPAGGRSTLQTLFAARKIPVELQLRSGLVVDREGRLVDRFRQRLMIPILRESGAIVGFGGRALDPGQVPKYLNSPETPLYAKGRTLYGLAVAKEPIRKHNYCVLVEGYFNLAQVWQAGVHPVVASCGTALTPVQARTLKRFTSKVVLNFDPDAAGQGAAARSSELLVAEGFQVNVLLLPEGADPDTFIRRHGSRAYVEHLTASRPYLDFLLDREAKRHDLTRPESRRAFLGAMLSVAATIPDAAARDQFADRLAHKARITEGVVRDEIRKAAAARRTEAPSVAIPATARLRPAEQGLLWLIVHRPVEGLAAIGMLEDEDLEGLLGGPIFAAVAGLTGVSPDALPARLRQRLEEAEQAMLDRAAQAEAPTASAEDCVGALKRLRYERELAAIQREIERLEQQGAGARSDRELDRKKTALSRHLEELKG